MNIGNKAQSKYHWDARIFLGFLLFSTGISGIGWIMAKTNLQYIWLIVLGSAISGFNLAKYLDADRK